MKMVAAVPIRHAWYWLSDVVIGITSFGRTLNDQADFYRNYTAGSTWNGTKKKWPKKKKKKKKRKSSLIPLVNPTRFKWPKGDFSRGWKTRKKVYISVKDGKKLNITCWSITIVLRMSFRFWSTKTECWHRCSQWSPLCSGRQFTRA